MNRPASFSGITNYNKLLIVKPTSLGDIVGSLCAVTALKRTFPDRHISFLVADIFRPIVDGHPCIDSIIEFPRTKMKKGLVSFIAAAKELRRTLRAGGYDAVLDLQGLARSAIATWFTGAKVRVGFSDARESAPMFYTHTVKSNRKTEHAIALYLRGAQFMGADPSLPITFDLKVDGEAESSIKKLTGDTPFVTFAAGARWPTKIWPIAHFCSLAQMINREYGLKIAAIGSQGEALLGDQIVNTLPDGEALNLCGKTNLKELVAAISLSSLLVTNDSGPMHISAALGKPTVSIFGPTSPSRIAPFGQEEFFVRATLPCLECYSRKCDTIPPRCMELVMPEAVFEAFQRAYTDKQ